MCNVILPYFVVTLAPSPFTLRCLDSQAKEAESHFLAVPNRKIGVVFISLMRCNDMTTDETSFNATPFSKIKNQTCLKPPFDLTSHVCIHLYGLQN